MKYLLAAATLCLAWPCAAQSQQPLPAAVPTAPAAAAAPAAPAASAPPGAASAATRAAAGSAGATHAAEEPASARVPEPQVQRIVVEDDRVRIDELRIRGQTRRIVVQPKLPGAPAYQIGVNRDARDSTTDPRSEGRALWQLIAW